MNILTVLLNWYWSIILSMLWFYFIIKMYTVRCNHYAAFCVNVKGNCCILFSLHSAQDYGNVLGMFQYSLRLFFAISPWNILFILLLVYQFMNMMFVFLRWLILCCSSAVTFNGTSVPDLINRLQSRSNTSEMQMAAAKCLTFLHRGNAIQADSPIIRLEVTIKNNFLCMKGEWNCT